MSIYIINKLLLHVYREGYIEIITYNYILKNLLIGIQRTDRLPLYHSSNISPPDALLNFLLLIKVYIPAKFLPHIYEPENTSEDCDGTRISWNWFSGSIWKLMEVVNWSLYLHYVDRIDFKFSSLEKERGLSFEHI